MLPLGQFRAVQIRANCPDLKGFEPVTPCRIWRPIWMNIRNPEGLRPEFREILPDDPIEAPGIKVAH